MKAPLSHEKDKKVCTCAGSIREKQCHATLSKKNPSTRMFWHRFGREVFGAGPHRTRSRIRKDSANLQLRERGVGCLCCKSNAKFKEKGAQK